MPEMKDDELKKLFSLLIPDYIDFSCIACGYHNEIPIAIIATDNDVLSDIIKHYSIGVTQLDILNIPEIKYHLSGNKSLWAS